MARGSLILITRVPVLFPVEVSLAAPVDPVAVNEPNDVGVPVTGQVIKPPALTVAGVAGVHVPSSRPGGRPLVMVHEAEVAVAALAALRQVIEPE
jgi:hypothetical protein